MGNPYRIESTSDLITLDSKDVMNQKVTDVLRVYDTKGKDQKLEQGWTSRTLDIFWERREKKMDSYPSDSFCPGSTKIERTIVLSCF